MRARKLKSTAIERVAYDEDQRTLRIWFKSSGMYLYSDVPRAIYDALCSASSAGGFFRDSIRGRFDCRFDPALRRFRPSPQP